MSKITLEQLQTELDNGLTNKKIAEKYAMNIRSVERRRAQIGALSGRSTLVRHKHKDDSSTGKILEWIKTRVDIKQQIDAADAIIQDLVSNVKPLPLIKYDNKKPSRDLVACIPLGDPHIGLMT